MDTGDLLLLVMLIILGVLGLAYVVFVLGNRAGKQYVLSCPPCAVGGSSTIANPVSAPLPLPPGMVVQPPNALSTLPGVPPVNIPGKIAAPANSNVAAPVPLAPLAASPAPIPTNSTILFRNRANGRYLSVCQGCSSSAPLVVMAHESNPMTSYVQWAATPSGNGWLLNNKFSPTGGVLQALPNTTIYALKQNDQGAMSTVTLAPVDSQGYRLAVGASVLQVCCPNEQSPQCACPQFKDSATLGVTAVPAVLTSPVDPRQIWDLYVLPPKGTPTLLRDLSPAQRFLERRRL
jgi:hypothetical protein